MRIKTLNNCKKIILIFAAAAALTGCGKTVSELVDTPVNTVNPYVRIDSYNNKGMLLKEEFFGSDPYCVEYNYDETGKLLNAVETGRSYDRTIYRVNCYYNGNLLMNKITYDRDGVIEENCSYKYSNGVLQSVDRTYYDKNRGKVVEISEYDYRGNLTKVSGDGWYTEYIENGEFTYKKTDGQYSLSDKKITFYNDNGEIIRVEKMDSVDVYLYYSDGNLDRVLTYMPDDSTEDNLRIGEVYEYDEDGNNVKKTTYRFFGDKTEVEYVVQIQYDQNGNPTEQTTNEKIDFKKEYVYFDNGKIKEVRYLT